jgi:acyl-coenzyme A synthetase/AMP-(fatty) acid ligase
MGQQVKATVQLAGGVPPGQAAADELAGFLRTRIARFKVPRRITFPGSARPPANSPSTD